jgi:putative copper export protein
MLNILTKFNEIRKPARTYLCYLLQRHIPNKMPAITAEILEKNLEKVINEVPEIDAGYILDATGTQIIDNISKKKEYILGKNINRNDRGFFYRAVKEKKCILTDPYPSSLNGELVVSASMPVYNDKNELQFIVVIDLSLEHLFKAIQTKNKTKFFINFSKSVYTCFSAALFVIAFILFTNGIASFFQINDFFSNNAKKMFHSTILLTLSLAIFDLVKTIFEEEVLGKKEHDHPSQIHKTMVKFLGSIIIALAIESLMLVFKFALTSPDKIVYASILIIAVTILIVALAYYIKSVSQADMIEEKCEK